MIRYKSSVNASLRSKEDVYSQICVRIIETFENSVPQRKVFIFLSLYLINFIKWLKELETSERKGQKSFKQHCIKTCRSLVANITTRARKWCGEALSSTAMLSNIYRCPKNFTVQKRSLVLTLSGGDVTFSAVRGIWDRPSHSGNMYCGQINQYSRTFFGENGHCVTKDEKGLSRLIQKWMCTKNKMQSTTHN